MKAAGRINKLVVRGKNGLVLPGHPGGSISRRREDED